MEWLFLAFILVCIFIWRAPKELTKTLLAGVWVLMAVMAIGSTLYAIGAAFLH